MSRPTLQLLLHQRESLHEQAFKCCCMPLYTAHAWAYELLHC